MSYLLAACVYVSLFRYIDPWVLLGVAHISLLPLIVRRLNDSGLSWIWLFSIFICLIPLSITVVASVIIDTLLEESRKTNLEEVLLIYSATFTVCLLAWLVVRRDILRMLLILTFFTAPLWMLYQLLIAKSLNNDDLPSPQDENGGSGIQYKRLLFSFSGRLSRDEFWLYGMIPYAVFSIVLATIYLPIVTLASNLSVVWSIISLLLTLLLIVPSFSLLVKRLHDLNKSAWWLVLLIVPVAGALYLLVVTACYRGDAGANRYGERMDGSDDVLRKFYQRALSKIDKVRQSPEFNHFVMLSLGMILVLLVRDTYGLFASGGNQLLNFYDLLDFYNLLDFGITATVLQLLFHDLYIICLIAVSLFGMTYINKDSAFKNSILLLLFLLAGLISFYWINEDFLHYALGFVLIHLEVLLIVAMALMFIAFKGERSSLFIVGLLMTLYAICMFLYMLLQLIDGFPSAYFFLMYFSLLEIGLFLMYVDYSVGSEVDLAEVDRLLVRQGVNG